MIPRIHHYTPTKFLSLRRIVRRRARAARLVLEPLENRFAPAYVATFDGVTHILTVTSHDADNDLLTINDADNNGTVDVNGTDVAGATFASGIGGIVFSNASGTGSDSVVLDPENDNGSFDTIPATLDGGPGNDWFDMRHVAFASVSMTGGAGNDTLEGGDDDDSLNGGADHDSLSGGHSHDALDGGAGNDSLLGGYGSDTVDNDTLEGGDDNDYLNCWKGKFSFSGGIGG